MALVRGSSVRGLGGGSREVGVRGREGHDTNASGMEAYRVGAKEIEGEYHIEGAGGP